MAILSINTETTGLIGKSINPRRVTMVSTDSLSTILSVNYLSNSSSNVFAIYPTDIVDCIYNYNTVTKTSKYISLQPVFSGNNITLTIWDPGYFIISGLSPAFAGGSTTYAFTVNGLTSNSPGAVTLRTVSNAVSIAKSVASTNTLTITFTADPGANTVVSYIYTKSPLSLPS